MRRSVLLILVLVLLSVPAGIVGEGGLLSRIRAAGTLRVCADPNNLPFSSDDPGAPGFDVELAGEIARLLGVREEIVWEPTFLGQRAIRQLLEGRCDLFMGLPHDPRFLDGNRRLTLSTPYYTLRHILISSSARPAATLSDVRTGKVAVERGAMADVHLFREGYHRYVYRTQADAFRGFVRGEADAALLWEPVARWLMTRHAGSALRAVVVSGPDLEFKVAAGMRKGDAELQAAVDDAVKRLVTQGKVEEILGRYGMPSGSRVRTLPGFGPPRIILAQATSGRGMPRVILAQAAAPPVDPKIRLGRSLYYQMCAPCHGPDASGGGPVKDMKKFEGNEEEFVQTALQGRGPKGMPSWKGDLSEDELRAIRAFVQTIPR